MCTVSAVANVATVTEGQAINAQCTGARVRLRLCRGDKPRGSNRRSRLDIAGVLASPWRSATTNLVIHVTNWRLNGVCCIAPDLRWRSGAIREDHLGWRVAQSKVTSALNAPELGALLGGKYRVLSLLGKGGMGTVYRGQNVLTGKEVALKWMNAGVTLSSDIGARLLREAQATCRLNHPNVVNVFDLVYEADTLFLVMELLHGETLRSYLSRNKRPEIPLILNLLIPAMDGVAAAHERGVIHRDLKPDNIFLSRSAGTDAPTVKVLDFGVAKMVDEENVTLTRSGATLGTPLYMSIEQLRGAKDVDHRTDVYAFGIILYEAVTGRLPFMATTLGELAIQRATTAPPPVLQLRPDAPKGLARVIEWAIERERERRLPDVPTMIEELRPYRRRDGHVYAPRVTDLSESASGGYADSATQPTARSGTYASRSVTRPMPAKAEPLHGTQSVARWVLLGSIATAGLVLFFNYSTWGKESAKPAPHLVEPSPIVSVSPLTSARVDEPEAASPPDELQPLPLKGAAVSDKSISTDAGTLERGDFAQAVAEPAQSAPAPQVAEPQPEKAFPALQAKHPPKRASRRPHLTPPPSSRPSDDTRVDEAAAHELEALGGRL